MRAAAERVFNEGINAPAGIYSLAELAKVGTTCKTAPKGVYFREGDNADTLDVAPAAPVDSIQATEGDNADTLDVAPVAPVDSIQATEVDNADTLDVAPVAPVHPIL